MFIHVYTKQYFYVYGDTVYLYVSNAFPAVLTDRV